VKINSQNEFISLCTFSTPQLEAKKCKRGKKFIQKREFRFVVNVFKSMFSLYLIYKVTGYIG